MGVITAGLLVIIHLEAACERLSMDRVHHVTVSALRGSQVRVGNKRERISSP
jgi:hypothetical protein